MADTLEKHNYFGIDATVIADSKNVAGNRLTTFVITFPRIVLAEFNTHRTLSRNSASSRAVPFKKMLKRVMSNPFIPIQWMKNHKGMQGDSFFKSRTKRWLLRNTWLTARNFSVALAWLLAKMGLTKQIVNRLLEPWMWHTAIVSATEIENFYALRAEYGAEIHIQELAYKMLEAHNTSVPKLLETGEWHIPFGESFDGERLGELANNLGLLSEGGNDVKGCDELKVKIATARCARVSYINFEGKDDYEADIKLHDRLSKLGHWSPFEHCAQAGCVDSPLGNFRGFVQYRKLFKGENKKDSRLLSYAD